MRLKKRGEQGRGLSRARLGPLGLEIRGYTAQVGTLWEWTLLCLHWDKDKNRDCPRQILMSDHPIF